jgi:hypothetical protein
VAKKDDVARDRRSGASGIAICSAEPVFDPASESDTPRAADVVPPRTGRLNFVLRRARPLAATVREAVEGLGDPVG